MERERKVFQFPPAGVRERLRSGASAASPELPPGALIFAANRLSPGLFEPDRETLWHQQPKRATLSRARSAPLREPEDGRDEWAGRHREAPKPRVLRAVDANEELVPAPESDLTTKAEAVLGAEAPPISTSDRWTGLHHPGTELGDEVTAPADEASIGSGDLMEALHHPGGVPDDAVSPGSGDPWADKHRE
jgi:hypothetical protein